MSICRPTLTQDTHCSPFFALAENHFAAGPKTILGRSNHKHTLSAHPNRKAAKTSATTILAGRSVIFAPNCRKPRQDLNRKRTVKNCQPFRFEAKRSGPKKSCSLVKLQMKIDKKYLSSQPVNFIL